MQIEKENKERLIYLLAIAKKTQQLLGEDKERKECVQLLQELEKKISQRISESDSNKTKNENNNQAEKLLAKRKEVIENIDFFAQLFPIKSKALSKEIQCLEKTVKKLTTGERHYKIFERIQYIFPKPHAIAYTTTAWKTAYYKVYYPQEFYSVLLTYHVAVHDIWLMTLEADAINFRLEKLVETISTAKNSEKELISIIKVLKELNKGINEHSQAIKKKEEIDYVLRTIKELIIKTIEHSEKVEEKNKINLLVKALQYLGWKEEEKKQLKNLVSNGWNGFRDWKLTAKEKELLYTLEIILEMKQKNLDFRLGLDFNQSEVKNFQVSNGKILIPFSAITGIGEVMAKKIADYRQGKAEKIEDWKKELSSILNKNHLEQLEQLERFHLIIED